MPHTTPAKSIVPVKALTAKIPRKALAVASARPAVGKWDYLHSIVPAKALAAKVPSKALAIAHARPAVGGWECPPCAYTVNIARREEMIDLQNLIKFLQGILDSVNEETVNREEVSSGIRAGIAKFKEEIAKLQELGWEDENEEPSTKVPWM
jgi:hypothetical protein